MSTRFYTDRSYQNNIYRGATDPYFSKVSLLLHCDGVNASTTFTDNSPTPKTVTANGNAQISTAQSKFGGASAVFDANGDYLTIADNAAFDLDAGDFTIEFFLFNPSGAPKGRAFLNKGTWPTNTSSYLIYYGASNELAFYSSSNGTSWDITSDLRFTNSLSNDTWLHVAVVRNGTSIKTYLNGNNAASATSSATLHNNTEPLTIGAGSGGSNASNCYIDDFRFTKGIARYTANFTPPAAPFPHT